MTENLHGIPFATQVAQEIRAKIRADTGLTASAGVSYNKFLAKLASDQRKPDGMFVITPEMGPAFVEALPVGKFHGIGPATAAKMDRLGLHTGADLKAQSRAFLEERFGKSGSNYWISRGIDDRPVRPDSVRKSIGAENTFAQDVWSMADASAELQPIIDKVWSYCEQTKVRGRTVTLKVKFQDFQQITRSRSFSAPVESRAELANGTLDLLAQLFPTVKACGFSVSRYLASTTKTIASRHSYRFRCRLSDVKIKGECE